MAIQKVRRKLRCPWMGIFGIRNGLGLLCLMIFSQTAKAQFYNLPTDYSFSLLTEKELAKKDSAIHTGLKPYVPFFSKKYEYVPDSHHVFKYIVDDPAVNLFFYKHVVHVEPAKENFRLYLDPILNLEVGRDLSDSAHRLLYTNTRGFIASGYIGNKVYFESMFAENQSILPKYLAQNATITTVVPGQGRWKVFKTSGFDYAFSSALISMQPFKNLNIQIGNGKQKIGNGYRSLLLSDNSFNYPYARITQQWFRGRLQYSNIYAALMNLVPAAAKQDPNSERLFQKKAASFQYLSVNPTKSLNIGFFQGMIWQAGDDKNRQHLNAYYFNPLIYTNLARYGLNNQNNILIGADVKLKLSSRLTLYGQLMADDLSNTQKVGNGWGYQAGVTYFNALGIRNLFLQIEANHVSEGSYLNPAGTPTSQAYAHYGQDLAYTPGNGNEIILIADYKWKRFFTNVKYNYESTFLNGDNYYAVNLVNAKIGYLINPSYNLNVSLGVNYRMQNFYTFKALNNETSYIFVALKTSLYNLYYDF